MVSTPVVRSGKISINNYLSKYTEQFRLLYMARVRSKPSAKLKPLQSRHATQDFSSRTTTGFVPRTNPAKYKNRLSLNTLLPRDGSVDWPTVTVKQGNNSDITVLDFRRCYELDIKTAFYGTYDKVNRELFDQEMGNMLFQVIGLHSSVALHYNWENSDAQYDFLLTPPTKYWARVVSRYEDVEEPSFVRHPSITPEILVQFVLFAMDSFRRDNTGVRKYYGNITRAMEMLMRTYDKRLEPDYEGPGEPYGEREHRIINDGHDVEASPGFDGANQKDDWEDNEERKDRPTYKSKALVSLESDHEDEESDDDDIAMDIDEETVTMGPNRPSWQR